MINKKVLTDYEELKAEKICVEMRISNIESELEKMEEKGYKVGDSVKGGAGGIQNFKISGFPYGQYSKKRTILLERMDRLKKLEKEIEETVNIAEQFICDLDDSRIRRILMYRYIDGMSWTNVAQAIGRNATADSVRMEANRYLEKLAS